MFTHIDKNHLPTMVDVMDKKISIRMACAESIVQLPPEIKSFLLGEDLLLKKGPVFQSAIIAGTMAVKKTHELIPFCHQIPIEGCKIHISIDESLKVKITCTVKATYKTGIEMEALHGASVAALTIYDMCKAINHNIVIEQTKLVYKTGGKNTLLSRPTYGLVLTGGKSQRMGGPKALISYYNRPHAQYIFDILNKYCEKVFISAQKNQWMNTPLEKLPMIEDKFEDQGPLAGIINAFDYHQEVNWIIVACDLVYFNEKTVEKLLANFNDQSMAVAYKNREADFPEALCALYTPLAGPILRDAFQKGVKCPVKVLKNNFVELISQEDGINLANINTQEEKNNVFN